MKLNTENILLILILIAVVGLYFYKSNESFLYGGPYEEAQDKVCGRYHDVSSRKKCMCDNKKMIKSSCLVTCNDPKLNLPNDAKASCIDACKPIPGLDPCQ
jgi:hypothetical protein